MEGMLSQDEIDALLEQTREVIQAGEARSGTAEQDVKLYDFKRPEKFSREQIRSLERIHERFARLLGQSLSAYIRTSVNVKLESVTPLSYQDFVFSLPQPTLIQVVQLDPLQGQVAIEINPSVVFPMFEQLAGGRPGGETKPRPLTDIELAVVRRLIERAVSCITETWQEVVPLRPVMLRTEQDPQFAAVAAINTPVVVISLELTMGEEFGMMSVCLPDVVVDALLRELGKERIHGDVAADEREGRRVREVLTDVKLPVTALLGSSRLSVKQLRSLRVDDIVRLNVSAGDDIVLHVGNRSVFRGKVGTMKRRLAVRLEGTVARTNPFAEAVLEVAGDAVAQLTREGPAAAFEEGMPDPGG